MVFNAAMRRKGQPSQPDLLGTTGLPLRLRCQDRRDAAPKIFGKTLEDLLVAPGNADTVDTAISLVQIPSLANGDLSGNGMLGLEFPLSPTLTPINQKIWGKGDQIA